MLHTALVSDITITNCKFNDNGQIVINSHNPTDITSIGCLSTVNITNNQFCGMKMGNIAIYVRHTSEAPKINISNNMFANNLQIKCGILNADLVAINNGSLYKIVADIINVNDLQTNTLFVYSE